MDEESQLRTIAASSYGAGEVDITIDAWERIHAAAIARGDRAVAAEAATSVAMHLLIDTGLLAPVRGWTRRAARLLDADADTPIHAGLAVVQSYERFLSGDFDAALIAARTAIRVGAACNPAAAALGRVAEARCVILNGQVDAGLALLNEAAVAAVSGELDPLSTGIIYCEVICAMQALAQFDLAEQWTQAMERWRQGQPVGSIHGRCRLHRAEILRLRGACAEAEREAAAACDELRPYLRREFGWPLTELGRIRLRNGDLVGAEEAFLDAHRLGWDPQPGLALLRRAQGRVDEAVTLIREALLHPSRVPSKEQPPNNELRRAPLLDAQVEIELAAGNVAAADTAATELAAIATRFQSAAWRAAADLSRGRVHLERREAALARQCVESAIAQWGDIGAPFELAMSRLTLSRALTMEGSNARADLERQAALATLDAIGVSLPAPSPAAPVADLRTSFVQDGEIWLLTFDGETARLRDAKGLRYIARLLAEPGREFHALDLVAGEHPSAVAEGGHAAIDSDLGPLLDARAKAAYRRRLNEIDEDLAEACRLGDHDRAAQATLERDFLARELARAVGLGGRDRRAGSAAERARASVTRAIRLALNRVRRRHLPLAAHLDTAIRTGTYCSYRPADNRKIGLT